ncbi:Gfo/Idh/MocA family protein [Puniceicoccus vermicola]|uniref:Gfo/Idh/MocA family oxidoreductase n=1 Tax=Puniceicoccus vermicola TaxID=388746 RepID=A0A7X1E570_9BACT|nr:Gfo/Idh/MocA family oxidoreductase [Puniceicoccus vermicola]MBC2602856.1 Gfo/Idh/MocA family oxidoreductase [Puniceicoccus vermicola]
MPLTKPSSVKADSPLFDFEPEPIGVRRKPLRVALVGASGYSKAHFKLISIASRQGLYRLVGAAVINQADEPERCREIEAMGGALYDDFDSMISQLAGQLDICFIPTGIHHHAPMTIAALKAGANVMVEKPIAATIQEVAEIRQCAKETGRFVAVGFQSIYDPATRWLKNALLHGAIGKIRSIRSRAMWPRPTTYYLRNNWAGHLKAGDQWVLDSPFNNALAHQLNMMCFLAGDEVNSSSRPATVQAELYRAMDIESADTACLRIITENEISLHYFASHSCIEKQDPIIEIIGESGVASWSLTEASFQPEGEPLQSVRCGSFPDLLRYIGSAIHSHSEEGETPLCGLDIAEAHTLCVNGAHESSAIHTIPSQFLSTQKFPNGESQIAINDLQSHIEQAYQQGKLFSEIGIPWATSGEKIDMRNYRQFPTYRNPLKGSGQSS